MIKKDVFKHIVAIRTAKNNSIISGTGFFIKTENKVYLVTVNHVARDTTIQTDIWIRNLVTGMPISFKINQLNPMVIWLYHPTADIAILEVTKLQDIDLQQYILDLQLFVNDFNIIPERELTLTMYGMPDVYTDLKFSPFTCDSKPASDLWVSYFEITGSMFKCFMLDKPSTQGFSGGPVVCLENPEKPIFYGIIHGTRKDDTGGKLAVVVHSAYLFELIQYAQENQ